MNNFMLFKDFFRVFGDKDVIGIIAEYKTDKRRSNRGGKTTILEAIRYALNGMTRAPRTMDLIHRGQKDMSVEVVLIDGDTKHFIRRGCDDRGHSWIDADKFTKADEAQKHIDQLLGFDGTDFDLTCFFKQQDINQFMEMKPREKQKHLMQWLNNDHWLKLERTVLDDLSNLNKRLLSLKSMRDVLASQVGNVEQIELEAVKQVIGLRSFQKDRKELQAKLAKLQKSVLSAEQRDDVQERLGAVKRDIQRAKHNIELQESAARELTELNRQIAALPKRVVNLKTDDKAHERASLQLQKASAAKVALTEQVATVERDMTGLCPILKKSCDRIKLTKGFVADLQRQVDAASALVAERRALVTQIADARRAETHRQRLRDRVEALGDPAGGISANRASLKRLVIEKKKLTKQLVSGVDAVTLEQIAKLRQDIQQTDENIDKFNNKIGALREQLERAAALKKQLDKTEKVIRKVALRIDVRKYVAYMFGRNGIPAQEIENGFEEIEDETNFVLHRFGTNMSIMFNPDRELKQWEPACLACETAFAKGAKTKLCLTCGTERQHKRKDELTVRVLEGTDDYDFNMESGGGKTIVSFSNRLALTRLKQRKSGTNFNVLFLDEPDSALDRPNKKAFMDLITTTLIKKFGFEQVLWVSHDKTICESIPHVLKVTRHDKHSTAAWL